MQIDKMWWQCSGGGTIGRINCIGTEHKQKVELMHKCESECTSQRLLQLGFTTHSNALCFYCLLPICIFTPNCPQSKDFLASLCFFLKIAASISPQIMMVGSNHCCAAPK